MTQGFIKLQRKMIDWEWYQDINTFKLFMHLLLKANYKDKKWQGKLIKRSSMITGRIALSEETGLSQQQVRTSLAKLKSTNDITLQSTNRHSVITLVNYDSYQSNGSEATSQATNKQPTDNQQVTTTKKVKNKDLSLEGELVVIEDEKPFGEVTVVSAVFTNTMKPPTGEMVDEYAKQESLDLKGFFDYYESQGWRVGVNPMESWMSAARGWHRKQPSFSNQPKEDLDFNSTGWS